MNKKRKSRLMLWGIGVLLTALLQVQAGTVTMAAEETEAADVIIYDAAEFAPFKGRTEEEAAKKYVQARYISLRYVDTNDEAGLYEELPCTVAPHIDEGTLSEDTVQTVGAMCNYYRWLAGSEALETVSSSYMQRRVFNRVRDGEPNYDYTYSEDITPLDAVKLLMNERYSSWGNYQEFSVDLYKRQEGMLKPYQNQAYTVIRDVGFYKGWLLLEQEKKEKEEGRKEEEAEKMPFYSFPAQGYMPNDLLSVSQRAWTVWLDEDTDALTIPTEDKSGIQIAKNISVTVLHRESGQSFKRSMEQGNAFANASCIYFEEPADAGMDSYTGTYDVEVTGLIDKATGKSAKLCYTVTFFDPTRYLYSTVKEVSIDGVVSYVLPQQLATPQNIEKLTALLSNEVRVTGENGRNFILPVKGKWRYDGAESCWKNSVDGAKLPPELTDPGDVLTDFPIQCEIGDNQGLTFEMNCVYDLNYIHPTDGKGGSITIKRDAASAITYAKVYQITGQDGAYTSAIRYDTRTAWNVAEDRENHAFTIPIAYFVKDTGDYAVIGYEEGGRKAWLSDSIIPILVTVWEHQGPEPGFSGGSPGEGAADGINSDGGGDATYGSMGGDEAADAQEVQDEDKGDEEGGKTSIPKVAKVKKYKVKAKKKGFVLTWAKSPKASGYQVQISTKKNFKGAKKITIKKNSSRYVLSGLKPRQKYYIRIRACQTYESQAGSREKAYGEWVMKSSRTKG